MGKDNRQWRKLVKKLRRSRIRKAKAEEVSKCPGESENSALPTVVNKSGSEEDPHELAEKQRWHDLEEEAWKERERRSNILFKAKREKAEQLANALAAEKERIRVEWEEKQRLETEKKAEAERNAKKKEETQNAEFNQLLEFLSGDIETPPLPYLMPEITGEEEESCLYFSRTGACRFYERCRKPHPSPTLSSTILISNFFSHLSLEGSLSDDMDAGLEYEDSELYKAFLFFYEDVLPELQKTGNVIQFKVCRNFEPHLRGNVYVQYKNIREAVEVYRKFNARFYNGKQLTLRFIKLESWRSAICGQFNRGVCLKGKSCNYLHVFRNPTREFLSADHDWENFRTPNPPRKESCRNPPLVVPSPNQSKCRTSWISSEEHNNVPRSSSGRRSSSKHTSRERSRSIDKSRRHSRLVSKEYSRRMNSPHSSRKDSKQRRSRSPSKSKRKHSKRNSKSNSRSPEPGSSHRKKKSDKHKKNKKHKKKKSKK